MKQELINKYFDDEKNSKYSRTNNKMTNVYRVVRNLPYDDVGELEKILPSKITQVNDVLLLSAKYFELRGKRKAQEICSKVFRMFDRTRRHILNKLIKSELPNRKQKSNE